MSDIPTSWNERITSILSLFYEKYRRLKLSWILIPTIDYIYVMTNRKDYNQSAAIAGNVTFTITADPQQTLEIAYGRGIFVHGGGANTPNFQLQIRRSGTILQDLHTTTAIAAGNHWCNLSKFDTGMPDGTNLNDQLVVPFTLHENDSFRIGIYGGLVADSHQWNIRLEEKPIVEEFN